jgi:hypothetical protein
MEPVVTETAGATLDAEGVDVTPNDTEDQSEPPKSARTHWYFRNRADWRK